MTELICPKAECPITDGCWHAEYHDPDPDGWCSRPAPGVNGCPECITREEAERIKEVADAEDKGFDLEAIHGQL